MVVLLASSVRKGGVMINIAGTPFVDTWVSRGSRIPAPGRAEEVHIQQNNAFKVEFCLIRQLARGADGLCPNM